MMATETSGSTDLASRLLAEADFTHSLIAEAVAERRDYLTQREALLREAAAALSGREAVACQFQDREGKWCNFNNDEHRDNTIADGSWPIRWLYTTPQPGGGVVEANALSADELVELDKLVADVGPQQALNMFVELRAEIAGKVDEADRSIAELKRRAAAPSAKGVAP